jgi:hypothetical protein
VQQPPPPSRGTSAPRPGRRRTAEPGRPGARRPQGAGSAPGRVLAEHDGRHPPQVDAQRLIDRLARLVLHHQRGGRPQPVDLRLGDIPGGRRGAAQRPLQLTRPSAPQPITPLRRSCTCCSLSASCARRAAVIDVSAGVAAARSRERAGDQRRPAARRRCRPPGRRAAVHQHSAPLTPSLRRADRSTPGRPRDTARALVGDW